MEIACTLWVLKCTRIYVWSIQTWQHIHYTQTSNLSKSTINSLHCIMSILWRAAHDSKFPFHLWGEPVPLYPPSVSGSTFRQCSAFVNLSFPQTTWEQKKKKNWWRFFLWHRELLQHNLKCRGERARWAPKAKNWPTGKGDIFLFGVSLRWISFYAQRHWVQLLLDPSHQTTSWRFIGSSIQHSILPSFIPRHYLAFQFPLLALNALLTNFARGAWKLQRIMN